MKLFWICIVVCLTFLASDRSEKAGLCPLGSSVREIAVEQDVNTTLAGTVSKERLHCIYVLMREAFVGGVQLDNASGQHKSVIQFSHLFPDSRCLSAVRDVSLFFVRKYAEVLSVRHNKGFYLFFFQKLII